MMTASLQQSSSRSVVGDLVAVHAGKADVEEDELGPELAGGLDGGRAVVGDLDLVAEGFRSLAMPRAVSTLSSTTRMRPPAAAAWRRPPGSADAAVRRGRLAAGSRTMNSLPLPGPSLVAGRVPPCISTSFLTSVRPIPSPPRSGRATGRPGRRDRRSAGASRAGCRSRCPAPG